MKIEKISPNNSINNNTTLTLGLLSHRIGDEICDLVNICLNVENALGVVICTPKEATDHGFSPPHRAYVERCARNIRIRSKILPFTLGCWGCLLNGNC